MSINRVNQNPFSLGASLAQAQQVIQAGVTPVTPQRAEQGEVTNPFAQHTRLTPNEVHFARNAQGQMGAVRTLAIG